jgi:hypothetical protein
VTLVIGLKAPHDMVFKFFGVMLYLKAKNQTKPKTKNKQTKKEKYKMAPQTTIHL